MAPPAWASGFITPCVIWEVRPWGACQISYFWPRVPGAAAYLHIFCRVSPGRLPILLFLSAWPRGGYLFSYFCPRGPEYTVNDSI